VAASLTAVRDRVPVTGPLSAAERAALACPDPLATVDPAGAVAWANPAWTRLLGADLAALVAPEDLPALRERLADPRGELELCLRVRGERTRRIALAFAGVPGGAVSVCGRDVTERRRAEEERRGAERRFAEAFAAAGVGMALAGADGRITHVNAALRELLGRPERELLGGDLAGLTLAEGREADERVLAALLAGNAPRVAGERRLGRPDGRLVDARVTCTVVRDADGAPSGLVALVEDVTERRRMVEALTLSQARYGTLVRHLPDAAVVLFDRDLRVHMVEGALLPDAAALEGRSLAQVLPPERVQELLPHFRAAVAGEPRSFDHERLDGSATYWTQIVPLAAPDGAVFGGMAVFRDVTERRDAARALEAHARELEASNVELEQYASVASHDLAAPLRMISSYLWLLRRRHGGALGPDAEALVEQSVDAAVRMRGLIEDLLAYSQVGRAAPAPARVDCEALVAEVAQVLRAAAPEARIECDELPAVCGDPGLLRQLFQNLLANAVKFVPAGRRPLVRVRARGDRFEVQDNGVGIDPEHAERVFRMFQRLDTREGFAGTGIGLAIARKVVERHGGTIWVEPAEGGGSSLRFTLPLAQ